MNIMSKPVLIGIPMLMVATVVAVMALWALGLIGVSGVGTNSVASLGWNVEYWHRNADGELLEYKKSHNALTALGLEHAMERLIIASSGQTTLTFANPAAAQIGEANAFDNIVILKTDDTSGDIDAGNIALLIDGGGTGDCNPCDGTYADGGGDGGDGKVTVVFTATGTVTTNEMQLVKTADEDTADGGAVTISANDVLAVLNLQVTLANTDTLTITWTIDVNAA